MEYIYQRALLRRPRSYELNLVWDPSDLDGGCQAWQRFKEKMLLALGHRLHEGEDRIRREQQYLVAELETRKQDMPDNLLRERLNSNADKKGCSTRSLEISNQSTCAIEDSDSDDSYNDEGDTIYSQAHVDPIATNQAFAKSCPSSSSSSVSRAPSPPQITNMQYTSFDWADNVEESIRSAEGLAIENEPTQEMSSATNATRPLANSLHSDFKATEKDPTFRTSLAQYVNARQLTYENEQLIEEIENNRTLGFGLPGTP